MRNPPSCFSIIIFCLTLFLQGCNLSPHLEKEEPPQEPTAQLTIVYAEDSFLYLPLYAAIKQNFFQQENLTLVLQKTNSREAVEGLRTGQYDLMLNGAEIGFYVYQQEHEDKLVFIGQTSVKNGSYLLARKKEQPFTWNDLKGKVLIGTASGDASAIVLESLLRKHSLRPFLDVHLINNLPPPLRSGTFSGGTAQFILAAEPSATILEKEEAGQVVASLDEQLQVNVPTVFITTKSQLKENQELYQRFITALQQGLSWVNQHSPEEIATVAQSFFPEQEEKILLRGICRYKNLGCWPETPLLTVKELLPLQQLLLDAQELNSPLPLHELLAPCLKSINFPSN